MNLNEQRIGGRLGADPELRNTRNGNPVCNLRIAVNFQERKGAPEHTEWFSVVCFGQMALDCANHLRKGSLVYVEGRTRTRDWTGEDGIKRYRAEVIAGSIEFLGKGKVA